MLDTGQSLRILGSGQDPESGTERQWHKGMGAGERPRVKDMGMVQTKRHRLQPSAAVAAQGNMSQKKNMQGLLLLGDGEDGITQWLLSFRFIKKVISSLDARLVTWTRETLQETG